MNEDLLHTVPMPDPLLSFPPVNIDRMVGMREIATPPRAVVPTLRNARPGLSIFWALKQPVNVTIQRPKIIKPLCLQLRFIFINLTITSGSLPQSTT